MTTSYVLTSAAEADVRDIIRYTRKQWGDAQVRNYINTLTLAIEQVAIGASGYKDMSALYPGLRMRHCEHHYIFCLPREDTSALIVAIFHERMDLVARLAERLQ